MSRSRLHLCEAAVLYASHFYLSLCALGESQSAGGSTLENFEIIKVRRLALQAAYSRVVAAATFSGALEADVSQIPPDGSGAESYFDSL